MVALNNFCAGRLLTLDAFKSGNLWTIDIGISPGKNLEMNHNQFQDFLNNESAVLKIVI